LQELTHKEMTWYGKKYSIRTADKFNHDYEEIFIFLHQLLGLYKNVVILLITVYMVGGTNTMVILVSLGVGYIYFRLHQLSLRVRMRAFEHFYDLKYQFVKVLNEAI
jgi:hypothetical protein